MRQNFDTTGQNMFFQAPPSVLITTLCIDNHHCESEHVHPARGVFSCSDISIEFHDGEEDEDDDAVFLFMFQIPFSFHCGSTVGAPFFFCVHATLP